MIIIKQTTGSDLSDLIIDENQFQEQTGATDAIFATFEYDGIDWQYEGSAVDLNDYGISFTGTPVSTDTISVAYNPQNLWVFSAGKGINQTKINYNFAQLQQQTNNNELAINDIDNTALKKDGTNLTQQIIDTFQQQTPNILSGYGAISLADNTANFLALTGNVTILLPAVPADQYSHTISLVVAGSNYWVNINAATGGRHLFNNLDVDTHQTYSVLFIYNKLDNYWYYSLTQ